ncbi:MAG: hypothetical protein ACRCSG_01660 [Cellulosilyticaceae bacterium]
MNYCTNCGTEIIKDQEVCGNCDTKVIDMIEASSTTCLSTDYDQQQNYSNQVEKPKNTNALIAIILAGVTLVMPLVGIPAIIFGIIGLDRSKKLNGEGREMSLIAIIGPAIYLLFYVLFVIAIAILVFFVYIALFFNFITF